MPAHLKGRNLHIVGPEDDYDDEEPINDAQNEIDNQENDFGDDVDEMVVPEEIINKRAKIEQEKEIKDGVQNLRLTKHFREMKKFPPTYTGGQFTMLKDERFALCMNDLKVSFFDFEKSQNLGTHAQ